MLRAIIIFMTILLSQLACADLVVMDDAALSSVEGRQGISLDLQLALNANPATNASGTAWIDPVLGNLMTTTTYGGPNSSLVGTVGPCNGGTATGANSPCYLALSFANRPNQWLAIKDYYFDAIINTLHLDVAALKNDPAGSSATPNPYFDASVFQNLSATGTQCAFGGVTCTAAQVDGQHALQLSFHCLAPLGSASTCQTVTAPSYSASTGKSTGYTDILLSMSIGRMAVEFTTAGSGTDPVITAPTYTTDSNGSFEGLAIHDNNSYFAGAYVGGRVYVSGF